MVTAKKIIDAYFGGAEYVPQKLSEEGIECPTNKSEWELAEKMEAYYRDNFESVEDHGLAEKIHWDVHTWIAEHNK